jgi:predicted enzyme related to lactoylglutathione lyase
MRRANEEGEFDEENLHNRDGGIRHAAARDRRRRPSDAELGAKDTVALAKFYQAAFGMQETNRIDSPAGPEIFVNFGATVDAAKANKSNPVVIMHRDTDDLKDPIPHLIFNVKDMAATVAAIKAAGGTMTGDPRPFRNTGTIIGMAIDPAGNRVELIQRP